MECIKLGVNAPGFPATLTAWLLTGCGSSGHRLPTYEPPLARTNAQNVRTTAYTHTESDHLTYGNRNALGGVLHAAGPAVVTTPPIAPAEPLRPASLRPPVEAADATGTGGFHRASYPIPVTGGAAASFAEVVPTVAPPTIYGSAAADWSRWPAGTIFRIESTGQTYQVDDYGWALAGRNTIDLYQPTRSAMNAWGVRREPIQIIQWGDREESLRRLRGHQNYRHIKRMVLELEGKGRAAAALE